MKIGVCIRAKDEQKIICDWVTYYLYLGFDKIIIYDNLSNPSIIDSLTEKDILSPKIEIIIDDTSHFNQVNIYQEAVDNNKDLDWLLLCDTDEFIWIQEGTIKDFLSDFSEDTCTIFINWLVYGTGNIINYNTIKTVFEQFIIREEYEHFWNTFVKSFIRPKLIEKVGNVHITYNSNYQCKNVYNTDIDTEDIISDKCDIIDPKLSDNTKVIIVHYMTLDIINMLQKNKKNIEGSLLDDDCDKYTLTWYKSKEYGFRDNITDIRMMYRLIDIYRPIFNIFKPVKSLVINLERRKDRFKYVNKCYPKNCFDINFIIGYDGNHPQNNSKELVDLKTQFIKNLEKNNKDDTIKKHLMINPFTKGELGYWISFIYVLKKIIDENLTDICIFDDDCIFCENFKSKFQDFYKNYMIDDYTIIFLGGKMTPDIYDSHSKKINNYLYIKDTVKNYNVLGSFAYIISNKGAKLLYNYATTKFRGKLGVDYFICKFLKNYNKEIHIIKPFLIHSISNDCDNSVFRTDIR